MPKHPHCMCYGTSSHKRNKKDSGEERRGHMSAGWRGRRRILAKCFQAQHFSTYLLELPDVGAAVAVVVAAAVVKNRMKTSGLLF